MDFENYPQDINKDIKLKKTTIRNIIIIVVFLGLLTYYTMSAPLGNKNVIIHIASGESVDLVLTKLKSENSIRSKFILKIFVEILKKDKGIISGDYLIEKNTPVWKIAWQIGRGHHNLNPIRITIREGLTNEEIASLLADKLAGFRKDLFLSLTNSKQGYLFPDTYFFFPLDTADEIVDKLSNNFYLNIKNISSNDIDSSGKTLKEIVTMASILEGEANGKEDIYIISGILWKRISLGMPLQVDINKETYTNKGLPNEPINNPGLIAIKAALNPENSAYLYYLHDKEGMAHFAKSFEEHKKNINNYLK